MSDDKRTSNQQTGSPAPTYTRIVLKLSGESFQGSQGFGIDAETVHSIAREVKQVSDLGVQMAIIVGGGNIFRGTRQKSLSIDRATGDYMGMLSTVINGLALQDALEKQGVFTRLQSAIEMHQDADPEKVPGAKMFDRITYLDVIQKGLAVMDSTAISLCMDNQMPIIIFNMNTPGNIRRVVMGEKVGSTVTAG